MVASEAMCFGAPIRQADYDRHFSMDAAGAAEAREGAVRLFGAFNKVLAEHGHPGA